MFRLLGNYLAAVPVGYSPRAAHLASHYAYWLPEFEPVYREFHLEFHQTSVRRWHTFHRPPLSVLRTNEFHRSLVQLLMLELSVLEIFYYLLIALYSHGDRMRVIFHELIYKCSSFIQFILLIQ